MLRKIYIIILLFLTIYVGGCQTQQPVSNIVFSRLTGNYWQIWTIQSDGSGEKQLTMSPSDKRYPVWSMDGKNLLFRDNNNRAFSMNLASGEEKRILVSLGFISSIVEAPCGNGLLVVRFRSELMDSSELWLVSRNAKNRQVLTCGAGLQYDPAYSPDEKKIAYIAGHGYQTHELYIIDCNGENRQRLTDNKALELLPAISPDGKTIAYVSNITGNYNIWLMNIDGSNPRQITSYQGIDTRPCWSPEGDKILFVSNRSGLLQLFIMNADGSDIRQLTTGYPSIDPAWRRELAK